MNATQEVKQTVEIKKKTTRAQKPDSNVELSEAEEAMAEGIEFRHYVYLGLTFAARKFGDQIEIGLARCSRNDQFARPRGRTIALGRLRAERKNSQFFVTLPAKDFAEERGRILWETILDDVLVADEVAVPIQTLILGYKVHGFKR